MIMILPMQWLEILDLSFQRTKAENSNFKRSISPFRIILFDEPLASLDKEYRNYLIDMLFELSKTKIIFISSHVDRELLMQSADSVIKTEIINPNV